jgi:hypothetical protein
MAKKTKSDGRERPRERHEQRFEARPNANPVLSHGLGALGALAMGAGAWGQFGSLVSDSAPEPLKGASYILFGGALAVAGAIWLGTSGEPVLRVGDAGIGIEKGGVRRIPWYGVERIEWRGEAVRVTGKDQSGVAAALVVPVAKHPQAASWIVKEARERVPSVIDVPEDATIPAPLANAGESVTLEPVQVVGMRCVASDKIISYEPDARICRRCERVYLKSEVPDTCACGASLVDLKARPKTA